MLLQTSPTTWTPVEEIFMAAASGVASHLCFFIRGEHHMRAPILLRVYAILFAALLYAEIAIKGEGIPQGTRNAVGVVFAYGVSLLTSILAYRRFCHRLRHFPGPAMASVTKLWQTFNTLDSQNHILLDDLHENYGDFVRTGEIVQSVAAASVR